MRVSSENCDLAMGLDWRDGLISSVRGVNITGFSVESRSRQELRFTEDAEGREMFPNRDSNSEARAIKNSMRALLIVGFTPIVVQISMSLAAAYLEQWDRVANLYKLPLLLMIVTPEVVAILFGIWALRRFRARRNWRSIAFCVFMVGIVFGSIHIFQIYSYLGGLDGVD